MLLRRSAKFAADAYHGCTLPPLTCPPNTAPYPDSGEVQVSAKRDVMETLLLTFVVFLIAVLGMSLGTMLDNRTIKSTWGGLSNVPGATCAACTRCCEKKRDADTASWAHRTSTPSQWF